MGFEVRGGVPLIRRRLVPVGGERHQPKNAFKHVQISNEGANNLRVYFTLADFTADASLTATDGYIELANTTGFFDGPAEGKEIWWRPIGGTTQIVAIFYQRR